MSLPEVALPTEPEIHRQLDRILSSEIFLRIQQQAKLLDLIVSKTLEGEEITEKLIRDQMFPSPPYKDDSNIARRTFDLLRDTLNQYYSSVGQQDSVLIILAKSEKGKRTFFQTGQAYTPTFKYNTAHPALLKFRLGVHFLSRISYEEAIECLDYFSQLTEVPGFAAAAHASLAETMLIFLLRESRLFDSGMELLIDARNWSEIAITLAPHNWHGHAVLGLVSLFLHDFQRAHLEFEEAHRLSASDTDRYYGYGIYLTTVGQLPKALIIARINAQERIEDAIAQSFYGLLLYLSRRFDDAENFLMMALKLDRHCWIAHGIIAALLTDTERSLESLMHIGKMDAAVGEKIWMMPGLVFLCTSRTPKLVEDARNSNLKASLAILIDVNERRDRFQTVLLCIGADEFVRRGLMEESSDYSWLVKANGSLFYAYEKYDPLALWLHLWPVLDPLRRVPEYRTMLNRYAGGLVLPSGTEQS